MVTSISQSKIFRQVFPLVVSLVVGASALCLSEASVVHASVLLSNTNDVSSGYTALRGTNQGAPLDNYGEHLGIRVISTWDVPNVKTVGFALCQTVAPPSVNRDVFVWLLDSSKNKIATSTPVNMADLPYCTSYATTTPMDLTYFSFVVPFTFDNDESLILATEVLSGDTGIRVHTSNVNPSTIIEDYWCYSNSNVIQQCVSSFALPYFELNDTNVDAPEFSVGNHSTFKTRFTNVLVTGTTTAPKDAIVDVSYYIDASEINRSISAKNPTTIKLSWANRSNNVFQTQSFTIPTTTGTSTIRLRIPDAELADTGTFDLLVQFSNIGCSLGLSDCPFPDSYVYTSFETIAKTAQKQGATENYNTANLVTEAEVCGLDNFSACITNSLAYLFIPSTVSVDNFESLSSELQNRAPFVYAYSLPDLWASLFNPSGTQVAVVSAETPIGTINFLSKAQLEAIPMSATVNTIIGYLLWIMLAFTLYSRTINIFNHQEKTV